MENNPVLSIGIPTFNRASCLDHCLNLLCVEVGNNYAFEIIVSDNNSSDNTEDIVKKYIEKYDNIVYYKQSENLGFDKNIKSIFERAKGEYIRLHSDDDYLCSGSMNYLINIICQNKDIDLFYIHSAIRQPIVIRGEGLSQYMNSLVGSFGITCLTSITIKKDAYNKIENKDRYVGSAIYQVYVQLEMLKNNPGFCIIGGLYYIGPSGIGGRRNVSIGKVFIGNYYDILEDYLKYGLSPQIIKDDKYYTVNTRIIPLLKDEVAHRQSKVIDLDISDLEELFIKYFKDEEYFEEKLKEIRYYLDILCDLENKISK